MKIEILNFKSFPSKEKIIFCKLTCCCILLVSCRLCSALSDSVLLKCRLNYILMSEWQSCQTPLPYTLDTNNNRKDIGQAGDHLLSP